MKQIFTVFRFTFRDAVRKKAFIVSTVIILTLILILCALPGIISAFSGGESSAPTQEKNGICYYIDEKNLIPDGQASLSAAFGTLTVTPATEKEYADIKLRAETDASVSAVRVTEKDGTPSLEVMNKNFMSGISADTVCEVLTKRYVENTLSGMGMEESVIALTQNKLPFTVVSAGSLDISGYVLGIILTMLMFFAIYYYGYGVSMSIATEKTSRVMETLVVSAKPSRILIGKCLAMGALGLTQFSAIILFAVGCYKLLAEDVLVLGQAISFSAFTFKSAFLILVYFILGYALYAVMNAVCGASVSKIEDLQSAMMPVMLISMISFYVGYFSAIVDADSMVARIALYAPFTSPFILPFKLMNGDVPAFQIILSILFLLIAITVIAMLSIRIYSASVLHYGKRLKLGELYRRSRS